MRRALEHARRGLGRTTPNPVVGCCIVSAEGIVIGQGTHARAGGPHAEVRALDEAGSAARGATLYCTLEPCVHEGRTGPCTDRIIAAGIRRVVAAMEDPFPRVAGRGISRLRAHGLDVVVGVEHDRARRINQPFLTATLEGRPWVILKAATSLDRHVAAGPGLRTPLSAAEARRHAQRVRAEVDAVGVGSGTVLVDDPLLTAREVYRERPLARVVFDRRLRTPPTARLFSTVPAGPVIILTTRETAGGGGERVRALERVGATVVAAADGRVTTALRALGAFEIQSLLLEGGAAIHAAAWDEGVVDYVQLYVTPRQLGPAGVPLLNGRRFDPAALIERLEARLGPDLLIEGYVHGPR
jgi:diaminohydroxyphosphoribosylaminopyrimidine deaminase/5-amino-6-(5-phosphoribosylamino)uracil reductase